MLKSNGNLQQNGAVRKSILRNVDISTDPAKLKKSKVQIVNSNDDDIQSKLQKPNKNDDFKYHLPQANSVKRLCDRIKSLQIEETENIESISQLSTPERNTIRQKVSKCLNFPPHKQVFKIPSQISSSDPDLSTNCGSKFSYKRYSKLDADPIPNLNDFLEPIESLKLIVPLDKSVSDFSSIPCTFDDIGSFSLKDSQFVDIDIF